jgi:hypothetical protein
MVFVGTGYALTKLLRERESELARKAISQVGSVGSAAVASLAQIGPARPLVAGAQRVMSRAGRLVRELETVDRRLSAIEGRLTAIENGTGRAKPVPIVPPSTPRTSAAPKTALAGSGQIATHTPNRGDEND